MFGGIIPVIRGVENQRVIEFAGFLHRLEDLAEKGILVGTIREVMPQCFTMLGLGKLIKHAAGAAIECRLVLHVIRIVIRQMNVFDLVEVEILLGKKVRIVGPKDADVLHPRIRARLASRMMRIASSITF